MFAFSVTTFSSCPFECFPRMRNASFWQFSIDQLTNRPTFLWSVWKWKRVGSSDAFRCLRHYFLCWPGLFCCPDFFYVFSARCSVAVSSFQYQFPQIWSGNKLNLRHKRANVKRSYILFSYIYVFANNPPACWCLA